MLYTIWAGAIELNVAKDETNIYNDLTHREKYYEAVKVVINIYFVMLLSAFCMK